MYTIDILAIVASIESVMQYWDYFANCVFTMCLAEHSLASLLNHLCRIMMDSCYGLLIITVYTLYYRLDLKAAVNAWQGASF